MTKQDPNSTDKKLSKYRRMRNWWLSFNFIKRWGTVWTTLLITYTLVGFFAVPAIVKNVLTTEMTQLLGRTVSVERVYWNPFSLVFELEDFKILDSKQQDPTFSLDRLHLNLETASLYKWSLVVKQIEIDHPQLKVSRLGMKEFSFDDIIKVVQTKIEESQATPKIENEKPSFLSKLKFEITDVAIHRGMFYFNDEFALKNHSLTDFEFVIPLLSNFSKGVDEFIQPKLSGKINGSVFGGKSHIKPFKKSKESFLNLKFQNFDLAFLTKYLPKFVKPKLVSCLVDSDLSLAFDMNKVDHPYLSLQGEFSIREIDITLAHDSKPESIFKLDRLTVAFGAANLLEKDILVKKIEVIKPYALISRHTSGRFNIENSWDQGLLNKFMKELELEEKKKSEVPFFLNLKVEELVVKNGRFRFKDSHNSRDFQTAIDKFNFSMHHFSTTDKQAAQLNLSLNGPNGLIMESTGELFFKDKKLEIKLGLTGLDLTHFAPYYQPFLNAKLDSATVSMSSNIAVSFKDELDLSVTDSVLKLQNFLIVNKKRNDLIELPLVEIKLKDLSLQAQTINVSSVVVNGGGINLVRDQNFDLNLAKIIKLDELNALMNSTSAPKPQHKSNQTKSKQKFHYSIDQLDVKSFGLSFLDQALLKPSDLVIFPINISVKHFSDDESQPIELKVESSINKNSKFNLEAKVFSDQQQIEANLKVTDFYLPMLNPYLTQLIKISINGGYFNAMATVVINFQDLKNPQVTLKSTSSIDDFHLKGSGDNRKFISGKQVKMSDFTFSNSPLKIEIGKLFVDQLSTTVELNADNVFSVEKLVQQDRLEELTQNPKSLISNIEHYIKQVKSFNMAVDETELKDGSFYFTDRTVKPHYEIKVVQTNLTLDRIATNEVKESTFKLNAIAKDGSKLDATGVVNPFKKPLTLNFAANIVVDDLSRFTPYSGKYVGYEINKGKSNLVLNYKIENNTLTASNDVFINQFSFGNDVDSDEATSLPVRFALAMISDKNGDLELKLPVSGNLDDPDFNIVSAILTVTKNILTNIVTSPFSFLASLHGETEDIKKVNYQPGSSELTESELKKLEVLTKMLHDRPGLKIEVTAHATDEVDRPEILKKKLNRFIQETWYADLSQSDQKRTKASGIIIDENNRKIYLKMIELAYEMGDFKKERNFFNSIKSQPLEVMLAKLEEYLKVSDQELYKLAVDRGQVISNHLLAKELSQTSVFLTEPQLNNPDVKTSAIMVLK